MLDHHVTNPGFGDLRILDPRAEATVLLVDRLLKAMGAVVDADMARCLFAGLVTDTRNFRDAGAAAHRLAAELIEAGADPHSLVTPIMDTHPFPWLKVLAELLQDAELDPAAAGGFGHGAHRRPRGPRGPVPPGGGRRRRRHAAHRGRGRGRGRVQAGRADPVDDLVARRAAGWTSPPRRRRWAAAGIRGRRV